MSTIMFAIVFNVSLFAVVFMSIVTVWAIQDEWRMIRLLQEKYYVERSWVIIIFGSLSIIILWVFYLCSIIKWLG